MLEDALATLLREPVQLSVAGRTDAGVHARAQVASHAGEPAPAGALNGLLPSDIRVLGSERTEDAFDARRDAVSRTYRYRVLARKVPSPFEREWALHWRYPLDREALDACAEALLGTHDFTAFTPTQTYHGHFQRHVMRAEWLHEDADILSFWVEADSFMRHMVRALVGTMLVVAGGRMTTAEFERLLEGAPRRQAGDTAAAHGLYLESVRY